MIVDRRICLETIREEHPDWSEEECKEAFEKEAAAGLQEFFELLITHFGAEATYVPDSV